MSVRPVTPSRTGRRCLLAAALVIVAACTGATAEPPPDDAEVVDVFTTYRGPEADAFRAVLDVFTSRTGIVARHVGTADFATRLRERVRAGDPPDAALIPQPAIVEELADEGHLVSLDDVVDSSSLHYVPGADVGIVDDRRVAVTFRIEAKSLVWYPPATFRDRGYHEPGTWWELLALSDRISASGTTPWCIGMEAAGATGWVGTDWVEDLVLRMHGPELYDSWTAGTLAFSSEPVASAFGQFGRIALTDRLVFGGTHATLATPVSEAMLPMLEDPPRCLLSRQGSFQRSFLPDGTTIGMDGDVDVFPLPGIEPGPPPLVISGQLATAFGDDERTLELLAFLADPSAGQPWAARGGFVSPHRDFDRGAYADTFDGRVAQLVADAEVVRFDASDRMEPAVGTGTFWTGIVDYVSGTRLPAVLTDIDAGYVEDDT